MSVPSDPSSPGDEGDFVIPATVPPFFGRPGMERALLLARGVRRMLIHHGMRSMLEVPLANNRRADILALAGDGTVTIIEIKSSVADFRADHKWGDYLEFCDRFYFAVGEDFPQELIPEECGLIVADGYGAEILRQGPEVKLNAARRKTLLLRVAMQAFQRLHQVEDPRPTAF
ncbi:MULTISPECIES: MmcB family DNA repair protein [Nitrospirillum]|uniref:DNA repair protein MmcB-related protein n=1 Tax=Nitrospirillum amazonense TaxID=28077 RepID=A0A560ETU6_9PROT|nr:MmcB family DNA repair protein [Nitrospirillum amazonense]MEC4594988.1 MmcB family DNA repair protein [Nitrospirillum amazonense]TWB12789.1 hypothetical protein FBZ88_14413 [Nitrospirillum amazonense]